jgi:hypothetical protein
MKPEELEIQGGSAHVTSQGIAGKLRNAGLWYGTPQNSVVDGDAQLEAHRKDIEGLGKQANFFGNVSRYLWFAALPAMTFLMSAIGGAIALEGAALIAAAAISTVTIVGAGFWASQKAESLSVSKQFETSIVNARTTAQEIAKATGKDEPTVVVAHATPRSEAREMRWVTKVGHQETANKHASHVERYAPDSAAKQSHAARVEAASEAQAVSIV